jgi:hypothetical protein
MSTTAIQTYIPAGASLMASLPAGFVNLSTNAKGDKSLRPISRQAFRKANPKLGCKVAKREYANYCAQFSRGMRAQYLADCDKGMVSKGMTVTTGGMHKYTNAEPLSDSALPVSKSDVLAAVKEMSADDLAKYLAEAKAREAVAKPAAPAK